MLPSNQNPCSLGPMARPSHRLTIVGLSAFAVLFTAGCAANAPSMAPPVMRADVAPAAPPSPPPPQAAPAPPPTPPGHVSQGYAPPSAPPDPFARQPSAEALAVPAMAPRPSPAPPPAAARAPSAGPQGAHRGRTATKAPPPPSRRPPPPPPRAPPPPPRPADRSAKAPPRAHTQQGVPAAPVAPLLIYVGDLQMEVEQIEFAATLDKVIDVAEALGGYLAGRKDTSVQVRIPSARFREGLVQIEKIGEVIHRSVTADDVSEQYSDLEGRLVNLKATRHRLQEFLARSGSMADMLSVGHELERVAAQIEQIEGKMRYLRSRAAFSLVTVSLAARPKKVVKIADPPPPPPPPPREADLPISWLGRVNLDRLLNLRDR